MDLAPRLPRPLEYPLRIERLRRFDERHTSLWEQFSRDVGVAVERDAQYLNWRLVDKPEVEYVNYEVMLGEQVVAMLSYCVRAKHAGRVGYVMEALCLPGMERVLNWLLRYALRQMADAGADIALAWSAPHARTYNVFRRNLFAPFPERVRPIELHWGVRGFTGRASELAGDRKQWYLSYLDSDTV